jgi:hypothetical protein
LRISTAWISFLQRVRWRTSWAASAEPTAQRARVLVRHPAHGQQVGVEQLGERPRVEPVGLHARLGDRLEVLRAGHHHPSDVRLEQPGDPQRVTRRLKRHLIARRQAVGEQPQCFGRRRDAPSRAHPPVLADRDLAEVAVNV